MDELLHKTGTKNLLLLMASAREGDVVMQAIFREHAGAFKQILVEAGEQEGGWIDYLFKDGSMLGMNARILREYREYVSDEASNAMGWGDIYGNHKHNPLPWMRSWVTSDAVQPAPQETELSSYLVGQIDSDIDEDDLSDFSAF